MTVGEYVQGWLRDYVSRLRPSSQRLYARAMNQWYIPIIGDVVLAELRVSDAQKVVDAMSEGGLAPKTVKTNAATFASAISRAHADRLIDRRPALLRRLSLPPLGRSKVVALSTDEFNRWLHESLQPFGRGGRWWNGPMLAAAPLTGLRFGELRGLRWPNVEWYDSPIDGVHGLIHVVEQMDTGVPSGSFAPPKSTSGYRDVPFGEILADMLQAQKERLSRMPLRGKRWERLDLVFPNTVGRGVSSQAISESRYRVAKRVKIDPAPTFHALRHTYASMLVDANMNPAMVAALLGHDDVQVTINTYYDAGHEARASAIDVLNRNIRRSGPRG